MAQYLIVALIVAASAWYCAMKYLPASWRRKLGQSAPASGCGSGCSSCDTCAQGPAAQTQVPAAPAAPGGRRVIKLHLER